MNRIIYYYKFPVIHLYFGQKIVEHPIYAAFLLGPGDISGELGRLNHCLPDSYVWVWKIYNKK